MGAIQFGSFKADELTLWAQQTAILEGSFVGETGGSTGMGLLIHHGFDEPFTPVTHIGMRPILGVQRRRNIGVGA